MQLPKIVEVKGIRVLTTHQIAESYDVKEIQISQNFKNNRQRFLEGKHYISLSGDELRAFKNQLEKIEVVKSRTSHLYLWTEKGALLHAKSLNTDKAWQVYDYLVDFYFRAKDEVKPEVKQSSQKMVPVVNVPENRKMLEAIQKIRRDLTAMDVLLEELIRYHSEENYKEKARAAAGVIPILVGDTSALLRMEPKIIQRPY